MALSTCRETLKYTYVFAFYLNKTAQVCVAVVRIQLNNANRFDRQIFSERTRRTLRWRLSCCLVCQSCTRFNLFHIDCRQLEYLEGPAAADDFSQVRQKVVDKVAYCKHRRQVLISHVKEVGIPTSIGSR